MQLLTKLLYDLIEAGYYWAIYHPFYKKKLKITKSTYNPFLFRPTCKQISLLNVSFYYIVQVIKLLHNLSKVNITWFIIYYPYYKKKLKRTKSAYNLCLFYSNKLVNNSIWTSVCTASCLCFRYSLSRLSNLLKAFFLCS